MNSGENGEPQKTNFLGVPLDSSTSLPSSCATLCPLWISEWLADVERLEGLTPYIPLMTSADVRQDRSRICVVDPNRFPQGFNNVDQEDFGRGQALLTDEVQGRRAGLLKEYCHIHVVEEDYGSRQGFGDQHPYFRHLARLKEFIGGVADRLTEQGDRKIQMTSSIRITIGAAIDGENDPTALDRVVAEQLRRIGDLPVLAEDEKRLCADGAAGHGSSSKVLNVLNTSYPSDLEVQVTDTERAVEVDMLPSREEILDPTRGKSDHVCSHAHASRTKHVCSNDRVFVDHNDPRLYNSLGKHELFSEMHGWLVSFQTRQREQHLQHRERAWSEDDDECIEEGACTEGVVDPNADDLFPGFVSSTFELEARFDSFPGAIGGQNSQSRTLLCQLVGAKLAGMHFESPWKKVFVKDDAGCNGVGLCVFSAADLVQRPDASNGVAPYHVRPMLSLTKTHRMALRGRNEFATRRYVLQEGVTTSLLRYDAATGIAIAQLEVVLMFIDGRIFNYFIRQIAISRQASAAGADLCVSLNVADVSFVQRSAFENDVEYRDAFAQVRREWWRYEVAGRLAVLALAKQAKRYVEEKANPRVAPSSTSTTGRKIANTSARKNVNGAALVQNGASATEDKTHQRRKKQQDQVSKVDVAGAQSEETVPAFSRRLSGLLSRALNQKRSSWANDVMKEVNSSVKELQALLQRSLSTSEVGSRTHNRVDIEGEIKKMVFRIESGQESPVDIISDGEKRLKQCLVDVSE